MALEDEYRDLFTTSEVKMVFDKAYKLQADMCDPILLFRKANEPGIVYILTASTIPEETIVFMLDKVKYGVLSDEIWEGDEDDKE
jgi:hypothetical protein